MTQHRDEDVQSWYVDVSVFCVLTGGASFVLGLVLLKATLTLAATLLLCWTASSMAVYLVIVYDLLIQSPRLYTLLH
jgi:hypothetical protein